MLRTAIIVSVTLVITWNVISWVQDSLTFNPKKVNITHNYNIEQHEENLKTLVNQNVTMTEKFIESNDEKINAIYFNNPNTQIFIIYAHGNSGTIGDCINFIYEFGTYGSIIMFDYAGYGKSSGYPSSKKICDNAFTIWEYAVHTLKINPDNIILYGFSLGGAVVSHLAYKLNHKPPKAVIVQSSFCSSAEMAKQMLPHPIYHFAKFFMDHTLDSEKYLKKVNDKTKILIMHSEDDEMIGYHHSKLLSDDVITIKGSHNQPELTQEFWDRFMDCLK